MYRIYRYSGTLYLLEPSGPVQVCTGIAFLFTILNLTLDAAILFSSRLGRFIPAESSFETLGVGNQLAPRADSYSWKRVKSLPPVGRGDYGVAASSLLSRATAPFLRLYYATSNRNEDRLICFDGNPASSTSDYAYCRMIRLKRIMWREMEAQKNKSCIKLLKNEFLATDVLKTHFVLHSDHSESPLQTPIS